MRVIAILLALLLVAVAGLVAAANTGAIPALAPYADLIRADAPFAILSLAALLFLLLLVWRPVAAAPVAPLAPPVAPPPPRKAVNADAEVVSFLGLLQEKGRFVDFLMGDVSGVSDAQVGAAGRVLHEGCKAVLAEHFGVKPLRMEDEGASHGAAGLCAGRLSPGRAHQRRGAVHRHAGASRLAGRMGQAAAPYPHRSRKAAGDRAR